MTPQISIVCGRPRVMASVHSHGVVEINLLLSGSMRYFLGGRFPEVDAGQVMMFWAAVPHQLIAHAPSTECVWIDAPIGWFLRAGIDPRFVARLLAGEVVVRPSNREEDRRLRGWADEMASRDPYLARIVTHEVEAWLMRFARDASVRSTPSTTKPHRHIERMLSYIDGHYRDPIAIGDIAAAAGLNRTYATELFRKRTGLKLWDYVLRLRIAHAQRLLLTTEDAITTIALACGFESLSRFYAAFGRCIGLSPRHYRQAIQR
jgi:AraC family transcriptional regulator, melibiose operon regulatory protein